MVQMGVLSGGKYGETYTIWPVFLFADIVDVIYLVHCPQIIIPFWPAAPKIGLAEGQHRANVIQEMENLFSLTYSFGILVVVTRLTKKLIVLSHYWISVPLVKGHRCASLITSTKCTDWLCPHTNRGYKFLSDKKRRCTGPARSRLHSSRYLCNLQIKHMAA